MPITSTVSPSILLAEERPSSGDNTTAKFVLAAPPPARKRRQRASSTVNQATRCAPNPPACPPRPAPNRRRSSTCSRIVSPRSPFSSFLSVLDPPSVTRAPRKSSAYEIGLGFPTTRLSPTAVNTIRTIASGKSHRRSLSGPVLNTALSFENHFEPEAPVKLVPSPTPSYTSPRYILFQRTCALAALGGNPLAIPSTPKPKSKSKSRPTPIMTSNKNGHVNVLLMPKHRDGGAASVRSKSSASTSASKSKSRKVTESSTISSRTTKGSDPLLRSQRSLTPARGVAHDAFRPLPYATHAALDEFFGDPRKMNALHAHQSSSKQLGARTDEVGYGNSVGHQGADGWIWFDAIEEQEYAWLMAEGDSPNTPHTARPPPKEKKSKKRGLFGRRNSAASESSGGRSDWESFDALRRGSESGTSDGEFVDPTTYDLDPTLPPRYRTGITDSTAKFKVATLDAGAWDATVHSRVRQTSTSAPKTRRGRSRRGSSSKGDKDEERRRPPPLNLAAVTHTLASLGPVAPPAVAPAPVTSRRPSLPANYLFPPSLADAARADFVSSSYQPHPSKRNLNLDPETPWSANLPHETIYRSMESDLVAPGAAPGSPFKAIFARRGSLTPLPLRHAPAPLPRAGQPYEFKGTGAADALPKLPPMPMENGAPAPAEGKRKTSLADIFRRGFGGKGSRK